MAAVCPTGWCRAVKPRVHREAAFAATTFPNHEPQRIIVTATLHSMPLSAWLPLQSAAARFATNARRSSNSRRSCWRTWRGWGRNSKRKPTSWSKVASVSRSAGGNWRSNGRNRPAYRTSSSSKKHT